MSSTNRSLSRESHVSDYYVTPVPAVELFIKSFEADYGSLGAVLVDPCAGGDDKNPMSYPKALATFGYLDVRTSDIRDDSLADNIQSYEDIVFAEPPDCIITNPPFNLALPIIEWALSNVKCGGYVVMILRLNFFGSQKRKPFFDDNKPLAAYVHSQRMKFLNTKGTDSVEYMHCVWKKGTNPEFTQLRII